MNSVSECERHCHLNVRLSPVVMSPHMKPLLHAELLKSVNSMGNEWNCVNSVDVEISLLLTESAG